nr:hypothetical protein [Thiomicrorhabdus sp.]
MPLVVAQVVSSVGSVTILNTETGEERVAKKGSEIFYNETLLGSEGAVLSVAMVDGRDFTLNGDFRLALDNQVISEALLDKLEALLEGSANTFTNLKRIFQEQLADLE